MPEIKESTINRINWWEYFFFAFLPIEKEKSMPKSTATASIFPLLLYLFILWIVNFVLMSSYEFIEFILSIEEKRGSIDTQSKEMLRIGFEYIYNNVGIRILVTGLHSFEYLVFIITFLCFMVFIIGWFSENWASYKDYFLIGSTSLLPLIIGGIIYGILRLLRIFDNTDLSLALFLPLHMRVNFFYEALNRYDLFSIWFLYLLSYRIAKVFSEKVLIIFLLLNIAYTASILLSLLFSSNLIFRFLLPFYL